MLLQTAKRGNTVLRTFRHFGVLGLFFLCILDSSPLPTFAGPDILVAFLASTHRSAWYECAAVAAVGSTIGAFLTFRLARKAGSVYLNSKFGQARVTAFLEVFKQRGTSALVASTAIPFPFPTSLVFAAAGASGYPARKYGPIVAVCRMVRYASVGIIAEIYGRHFVRIFTHPAENWGWLLVLTALILVLVGGGILLNRRLTAAPAPL